MTEVKAVRKKSEEQFPLLHVTDEGIPGVMTMTPGFKIPTPQRSWIHRWPEYVSACWLLMTLLTIGILGVYVLAVAVNKRQIEITRYFNDKFHQRLHDHNIGLHATDVFYHKIIPSDQTNPWSRYSNYIADMAHKYPYLKFHVTFLVDDSIDSALFNSRSRIFQRLPYKKRNDNTYDFDSISRKCHFNHRYTNINITTVPLSQYIERTTLKYRWRALPIKMIPFYLGVHSVWKHGGFALDLDTFNGDFNLNAFPDLRIKTIFDNYNDGLGVKPSDLDEQSEISVVMTTDGEETAISEMFSRYFLSQMFKDVLGSRESAMGYGLQNQVEPLIRKQRNKREVADMKSGNEISRKITFKRVDTTEVLANENNTDITPTDVDINASNSSAPIIVKPIEIKLADQPEEKNDTDESNSRMLFFDFTIFSDLEQPMLPSFDLFGSKSVEIRHGFPWLGGTENKKRQNHVKDVQSKHNMIVVDYEGRFISTNKHHNQFLGHLLSSPMIASFSEPRSAIENAYSTHCFGFLSSSYCEDIYFL